MSPAKLALGIVAMGASVAAACLAPSVWALLAAVGLGAYGVFKLAEGLTDK